MLLSTVDIGSFTDYKDIFYASSDPTTHPDGPHRIFWMRNMAVIITFIGISLMGPK